MLPDSACCDFELFCLPASVLQMQISNYAIIWAIYSLYGSISFFINVHYSD